MENDKSQKRIKELEIEIEKLKKLVINDELTGILNRRGVDEKLEFLFKEALYTKSHPESKRKFHIDNLSVIYIDLDDFKKVNDTYGHSVGDEVLKHFAELVQKEVRDVDMVGRLGGEEFVAALIGATEDDAYRKAKQIKRSLKENFHIQKNDDLKITASIGVASIKKTESKSISELIDMADKAMYEAKTNRGKDNVVKYSEII